MSTKIQTKTPMKVKIFSPENSVHLFKNYGRSSLKSKLVNKLELQRELKLTVSKETLLIGISTELTDAQHASDLLEILKGSLSIGCQVIVRACGTQKYQKIVEKLEEEYPSQLRVIQDSEKDMHRLYGAADVSLFLVNNKHAKEERLHMMNFAVIPVSVISDELDEYHAQEESGNAFIIHANSIWNIFEAVVRAKENYKFPYDWKNLQLTCMS
ncbi:hypothetical protein HON22_01455 [Candidatus Peregrinibacteria bacterium]|jgi:glycogen synthase|nr:hypothetical protein [Candidatus Peregrinibacteria bacterium]